MTAEESLAEVSSIMTTSESEMLILNSTGKRGGSTIAARLLITPVDTTIGLGFVDIAVGRGDVEQVSLTSDRLLKEREQKRMIKLHRLK